MGSTREKCRVALGIQIENGNFLRVISQMRVSLRLSDDSGMV
jgi:hypothetical protein